MERTSLSHSVQSIGQCSRLCSFFQTTREGFASTSNCGLNYVVIKKCKLRSNENLGYLATAPATTRTARQIAEQMTMAAMCAPFIISSEPPAM